MSNQAVLKYELNPPEKLLIKSDLFTEEELTRGDHLVLISELASTIRSLDQDIHGLSAPEIGVNKRIFLMKVPKSKGRFYVFINPELTVVKSKQVISKHERCACLPKLYEFDIPRFSKIKVSFLDENLKRTKLRFEGYMSFLVQHLYEHLEGEVLFNASKGDRIPRISISDFPFNEEGNLPQESGDKSVAG